MRLLVDENLSHRLVAVLADLFPRSLHVRDAGLQAASDTVIWTYAQERGLTIVSKDSDFRQRSFLLGAPPKVVWVRQGNCSTTQIGAVLRRHHARIGRFVDDPEEAFLVVDRRGRAKGMPRGTPRSRRRHPRG